ncbi:MAG: hypothetical protein F6K65_10870 [Moorea sp. SIO3C2]|nr:hypothetical protein [Moorena sp. SIO3C2]
MRLARRATLRSGSVSAKPTLRERKAWPTASASAKSDGSKSPPKAIATKLQGVK